MTSDVTQSHLGKATIYPETYDPSQLFPISRHLNRKELGIEQELPFSGYDLWNAFEVSWLTPSGKPEVAILEVGFAADSPNLIESKSFKLYLNSFNGTVFESIGSVRTALIRDLTEASGAKVHLSLYLLDNYSIPFRVAPLQSNCIDNINISYQPQSTHATSCLQTTEQIVHEKLYSNLLKSNCPVTSQPDWGTLVIEYNGKQIDHAGLLKYIISFRTHNEFHEMCVERVFTDIMTYCQPKSLTVYAHYTRRGGLDINPVRSTEENIYIERYRLIRQ